MDIIIKQFMLVVSEIKVLYANKEVFNFRTLYILQNTAHTQTKRLLSLVLFALISTVTLLIWCHISDSIGLMAFAYLSVFDLTRLSTSLLTHWIRRRQQRSSNVYTFGYERVEVLAVFSATMLAQLSALFVVKASVQRVFDQPKIDASYIPLGAALATLVNVLSTYSVRNPAFGHVIEASSSSWLQEHTADISQGLCRVVPGLSKYLLPRLNPFTLIAAAANVSLVVVYLLVSYSKSYGSDTVAALCIALMIGGTMLPMAVYCGRILLQTAPSHVIGQLDKVLSEASTIDGVLEFRNEHFFTLSFGVLAGSLTVRIRRDAKEQLVLAHIAARLSPLVPVLTVQVFKDHWSTSGQAPNVYTYDQRIDGHMGSSPPVFAPASLPAQFASPIAKSTQPLFGSHAPSNVFNGPVSRQQQRFDQQHLGQDHLGNQQSNFGQQQSNMSQQQSNMSNQQHFGQKQSILGQQQQNLAHQHHNQQQSHFAQQPHFSPFHDNTPLVNNVADTCYESFANDSVSPISIDTGATSQFVVPKPRYDAPQKAAAQHGTTTTAVNRPDGSTTKPQRQLTRPHAFDGHHQNAVIHGHRAPSFEARSQREPRDRTSSSASSVESAPYSPVEVHESAPPPLLFGGRASVFDAPGRVGGVALPPPAHASDSSDTSQSTPETVVLRRSSPPVLHNSNVNSASSQKLNSNSAPLNFGASANSALMPSAPDSSDFAQQRRQSDQLAAPDGSAFRLGPQPNFPPPPPMQTSPARKFVPTRNSPTPRAVLNGKSPSPLSHTSIEGGKAQRTFSPTFMPQQHSQQSPNVKHSDSLAAPPSLQPLFSPKIVHPPQDL